MWEEGEEEIGRLEEDGKGRCSRVLECAKATGKHLKILNVCLRTKKDTNSLCYSPNQDGCRDKQVGDTYMLNTRDRDGSHPRLNERGWEDFITCRIV